MTITLSKGKHDSREDGACAMELTSMLAGEPFSDHPRSVCPVIGSFLRAYNDRIDDGRQACSWRGVGPVFFSRIDSASRLALVRVSGPGEL
jgi:hypothetical protein